MYRSRSVGLSNAYPGAAGLQELRRSRLPLQLRRSAAVREPGDHCRLHAEQKLPSDERGHVDITGRYDFWHGELSWNRSDFYDLFGPTKRSRKGYAAKLGYDWEIYNDEPRKLDLLFDVAYLRQDRHPAQRAERRDQLHATGDRRRSALHYTNVKRSLGAVDDEKGVTWELDLLRQPRAR